MAWAPMAHAQCTRPSVAFEGDILSNKSHLSASEAPAPDALSRRRLFAGAGSAGVLAAAAAVLPLTEAAAPEAALALANDADAGYRLTEHIQSYYRTARV